MRADRSHLTGAILAVALVAQPTRDRQPLDGAPGQFTKQSATILPVTKPAGADAQAGDIDRLSLV